MGKGQAGDDLLGREIVDGRIGLRDFFGDHATRRSAETADANDRFVTYTYALWRDSGLIEAGVPRELGGGEADVRDLSEMLRTGAQACGSTALAVSMHRDQAAILAWHPLFQIIATTTFPRICAVYLGVAESARDLALDHAHRKPTNPYLLNLAGRMETSLRGAQLARQSMVAGVERNAPSDESVNDVMIGRTLVAAISIRTVELAGGAGFYRSADLERHFRDVQGARYHPLQDEPQAEYAGALPLGQPVAQIF